MRRLFKKSRVPWPGLEVGRNGIVILETDQPDNHTYTNAIAIPPRFHRAWQDAFNSDFAARDPMQALRDYFDSEAHSREEA